MRLLQNRMACCLPLLVVCFTLAVTLYADNDGDEHGHDRRRRSHDHREKAGDLEPVRNAAYADACGACHFAYQPGLLPAASWRRIVDGTDDHFGETVDLAPEAGAEIGTYLAANAAKQSSAGLSQKIWQCLNGQAPLRITEIPCIRKEHRKIAPEVFKRDSIGSLSNCIACHRTAENGVFDDEEVAIPE